MNRPKQVTIFGGAEPARPNPQAFFSEKANGYAARPGTGPEGESCGTCAHCRYCTARGRRFYKCGRMLRSWTKSRDSDVLVHSPACDRFEKGLPQPTTATVRRMEGGAL